MRNALHTIALATLLTLPATAGEEWVADYDEGVRIAKAEGKDLLVDFTGTDWCIWCIRLHDEVFAHEEFLGPATEQYVLVALDFPRGEEAKAKVPNPERNAELAAAYGVRRYPTVLLMTAEGEVFGSTGYREGGPEAYVEHMAELRAEGMPILKRLKALAAKYAAAEGEKRDALALEVLDAFEELEGGSPFARLLVGAVRDVLTTSEGELRLRALKALIAARQVDDQAFAIATRLDPKNERGIYLGALMAVVESISSKEGVLAALPKVEAFIAAEVQIEAETAIELHTMAASWNHRFKEDAEKAKHYAEKALALIGEDGDERLIEYLNSILED